ncbi:MAG: hypothetical protein LAT76_11940, partial [Schleiferiaceae bacterium]|nr:hypothetical protein [Schleiferiaceae bacterium]
MKLFLSALALFIVSEIHGQNLVPNPYFEEISFDPWVWGCCGGLPSQPTFSYGASLQNQCANHWDFNSNYSVWGVVRPCFPAPFTPGGGIYPFPQKGTAFAQLFANFRTLDNSFTGRFLNTPLADTLIKDTNYCVEFYIQNSPIASGTSTSPGVLFTDTNIQITDVRELKYQNPQVFPQIHFPGVRINPNTGWQHLKGSFIANGGEQFLTLGSFFDMTDSANEIQPTTPISGPWSSSVAPNTALWLIDAVYCYKCSDTLFTVDIGRDTTLCSGDNLSLHAFYDGFKLEDSV